MLNFIISDIMALVYIKSWKVCMYWLGLYAMAVSSILAVVFLSGTFVIITDTLWSLLIAFYLVSLLVRTYKHNVKVRKWS